MSFLFLHCFVVGLTLLGVDADWIQYFAMVVGIAWGLVCTLSDFDVLNSSHDFSAYSAPLPIALAIEV